MENQLLYSISGYLVLRLEGESVERFFNMCIAHNIEIWSISRLDKDCLCSIYASEFKKIHPIARKSKTKVKVISKRGFPFQVPTLKKYSWAITLSIILIALIIYSHNFIWAIEYVGNIQISDDELNDFIASENIYYGVKKTSIDCDEEEKNIRVAFPNIIWTSIYFEGTKLYVSIKENEMLQPEANNIIGTDIVAGENGEIVSILVRNGVAQVKTGDMVEKGQVLVSGSVPVYDENLEIVDYQIYDADADILIQTNIEYTLSVDYTYSVIYYTGNNIKSHFIQLCGHELSTRKINSFFREKENMRYETITSRTQLKLSKNFYIPVFYGEIDRKEYYVQYLTYTENECVKKLTEDFKKIISSLEEKGIKIVEKNTKMVQNSNSMELYGSLVVIKQTGVSE